MEEGIAEEVVLVLLIFAFILVIYFMKKPQEVYHVKNVDNEIYIVKEEKEEI